MASSTSVSMSELAAALPREPACVSTVLTTVEILESVLLQLDMRSLLTSAQGVCRQWRDLIQASTPLQRALFFEQNPSVPRELGYNNPLLAELFPPFFALVPASAKMYRGFKSQAVEALPIFQGSTLTEAFNRPDASWRRMHVRQPAVQHVAEWTLSGGPRWKSEKMKLVKYPQGLRMEGLYAAALRHLHTMECMIRWGGDQNRRLSHYAFVEPRMKEPADELVRLADVIIAGMGRSEGDPGVEKGDTDGSLAVIGDQAFIIGEDSDWETVWEQEDYHLLED